MSYVATIREVATGEEQDCQIDLEWNPLTSPFWWSDGNYGCDCNRQIEFERTKGLNPDADDAKCGDGRFLVVAIKLPDGTQVYSEASP